MNFFRKDTKTENKIKYLTNLTWIGLKVLQLYKLDWKCLKYIYKCNEKPIECKRIFKKMSFLMEYIVESSKKKNKSKIN